MNRRKATLVLASIVGVMAHKVKAEDQQPSWSSSGITPMANISLRPTSMIFDLKGFKDYTFHLEGKTLTFTPEELFEALSS
jgi:hypothetical protein